MKDTIMRLLTDVMHHQKTRTEATKELLNLFSVSARTFDPDYDEVDCDHYEYQQMPDDADEVCHLGIGIDNCAHCYRNRALYVH